MSDSIAHRLEWHCKAWAGLKELMDHYFEMHRQYPEHSRNRLFCSAAVALSMQSHLLTFEHEEAVRIARERNQAASALAEAIAIAGRHGLGDEVAHLTKVRDALAAGTLMAEHFAGTPATRR